MQSEQYQFSGSGGFRLTHGRWNCPQLPQSASVCMHSPANPRPRISNPLTHWNAHSALSHAIISP
ncbi:hypothetical protein BV25DRAFT_1817406 [Artomyces pyxidatus]|uniref:Uncharacterized protein n=1 Tax=Artomyces pyxidatus TaxID=48021 RepID=A0ACB8TJA6_9AGAM|nr:hypothetical protein BV25DRAFT_1817406 [Artomyces pyxidatus]